MLERGPNTAITEVSVDKTRRREYEQSPHYDKQILLYPVSETLAAVRRCSKTSKDHWNTDDGQQCDNRDAKRRTKHPSLMLLCAQLLFIPQRRARLIKRQPRPRLVHLARWMQPVIR